MNSCGNCDKPARLFKSGKPQLWCSEPCRKERLAKDTKAARADNPRPRAQFNCVCQLCGAPFVALYPRAKWCSKRCSDKAHNSRSKQAIATHQCAVCAKHYRARWDDRTPTCGRSCSKHYPSLFKQFVTRTPVSKVYFGKCQACKCSFVARRRRATCSELCEKRRNADRSRTHSANKKPTVERRCKECDTSFAPIYGEKRRGYCSASCSRKKNARIEKAKRRAVIRGATVKRFDPLFVLARDKWTCQLCGVATPQRLRGTTHDRAPELDHIIPLSKGGAHSVDNTQCACRRCNRLKGNAVIGQLLIEGMGGAVSIASRI